MILAKSPGRASLNSRRRFPGGKNNKSLPNLAVRQGQMGDGSSPHSLSRTGIWRTPRGGCRFPDATLHGKRSSAATWLGRPAPCGGWILSEAFQLASAGGCATGLQTRTRHACDTVRVLTNWFPVSHCLWRCVRPEPRVSPLLSQVAFLSQSSGVVFNIAGARKFFTEPAESRGLPDATAPFVRLSAVFRRAVSGLMKPARVGRTVLMHSSNCPPSG